MGEYFESYLSREPVRSRVSRSFGSEDVEDRRMTSQRTRSFSFGTETVEHAALADTHQHSIEERIVREKHLNYARIQQLIDGLSEKFGVPVRKAPRVAPGSNSSPRPSFFSEADFLRHHVPGIQFPSTVPYQEYNGHPSRKPIVMKNETKAKGQAKYLIENQDQLNRFRQWMEQHGNPDHWLAQEFIRTPGAAPCCYKVIVDCTGQIIVSHISYGPPDSMNLKMNRADQTQARKDPIKLLELADGEFCLNATAITSNHILLHEDDSTTGGRICLNPLPTSHPYNAVEKRILRAHALDTEVPVLPAEVASVASGIGRALGMKGESIDELVLGVDIIQNAESDEFFVLEVNRRPSLASLRDWLGSADSISEADAWRWLISGSMQRVLQNRKK